MNINDLTQNMVAEPFSELGARLREGRPLRVKLGIDPTSPHLHLGHAVPLLALQRFVNAGHHGILVIGDFTARIGDPTGRNAQRPPLSDKQIEENLSTFADQAGQILDLKKVEIRRNSEWLAPMGFAEVLALMAHSTVAQMLERSDFKNRFENHSPISLHEFVYPLAQAMDSVALKADIEIGGTDQTFNLHMGRSLQQAKGQTPQICITVPILEGVDGVHKMSKSLGNHIGLTDDPDTMFGRMMLLPDDLDLINRWGMLLGGWPAPLKAEGMTENLFNFLWVKSLLALGVVTGIHGQWAAEKAQARFDRTMQEKPLEEDMPIILIEEGEGLDAVLVRNGLAPSKREARRLIAGGGVRINGVKVEDQRVLAKRSQLQVGARKFFRLQ